MLLEIFLYQESSLNTSHIVVIKSNIGWFLWSHKCLKCLVCHSFVKVIVFLLRANSWILRTEFTLHITRRYKCIIAYGFLIRESSRTLALSCWRKCNVLGKALGITNLCTQNGVHWIKVMMTQEVDNLESRSSEIVPFITSFFLVTHKSVFIAHLMAWFRNLFKYMCPIVSSLE